MLICSDCLYLLCSDKISIIPELSVYPKLTFYNIILLNSSKIFHFNDRQFSVNISDKVYNMAMAVDLKLIFFSLVCFLFLHTTPCTFNAKILLKRLMISHDFCVFSRNLLLLFFGYLLICSIFLIVYTCIFFNVSLLSISDYDFNDYDYNDYDYYGSFTTSYFFMNFLKSHVGNYLYLCFTSKRL